jgi:hypothetical protein
MDDTSCQQFSFVRTFLICKSLVSLISDSSSLKSEATFIFWTNMLVMKNTGPLRSLCVTSLSQI